MADTGPGDIAQESKESLGHEESSQRFGDTRVPKGPLLGPMKSRSEQRKIATLHLQMWKTQDPILERSRAQWGVNAARRAGIANAKVIWRSTADNIDEHWTAWMPRNASPDLTPDVNKSATLCRRLTSQMFIDPFVAEVVLPDGDDDDQAAAELSERALHALQSESTLNEAYKSRRAFSKSHTYGSGYIEYMVDQRGGGQRVVKIEARDDAENAQLALQDPITGIEGPRMETVGLDELGEPIQQPVPFVERMVTEEGEFTEDPAEAAIEYLPSLKSDVLDSRYVRLIPSTAADIWEATGVLIAAMPTWGEVKAMAPGVDKLPEDDIKKMLGFRPKFADEIIPGGDDDDVEEKLGKHWNDERRVFVLKSYHLRSSEYEQGLFLITIGGQYVFHRSKWIDDSDGEERALDIPLTQFCGFDEGRDGYWKVALMELVGPGNEVRAAQIAGLLDHLEKLNNLRIFLPTNSLISVDQLNNPRATVLPMNPGGKPEFEQVPSWPGDSYTVYEEMGRAMDEAVGLAEGGVAGIADAKSGRQAFATISQVHAGLAEPRQNVERAYIRSCRITLQLARAFFEEEQEAKYGGEGGRYRVQKWKGADLVTSADIRIKPGSGTMLAPAAKAQLAERYATLQVIDHDDLREIITTNIGGTIGLQDNPHRLRIKTQLSQWEEGPPEDWQPPQPPPPEVDPITGEQVQGPAGVTVGADGMPILTDPVLADIFEPVPADTLPAVAAVRLKQIADKMAGPKYKGFDPAWRLGLDIEFQRMGLTLQQAQAPPPDPTGAGEEDELPGDQPLNKDGTPLNDLQEDAIQEGAPEEIVV